jgi:two-component system, OmpR family, phosphate regulon response regulator PhoB
MPGQERQRRILIIDDEQDVVSYLESILNDNGYEAIGTTDSAAGIELARKIRPDLICLDIVMPPPTGVKVYRELRDDPTLLHIPVVMITGVMQQFKEFIHHRKKVPPPDGYIAKPFEIPELLATLERLLGQPASG